MPDPTTPPQGCESCGFADGGCSLCAGLSVLEMMRANDAAEGAYEAAGAAKVQAAELAAHAVAPPPLLRQTFQPQLAEGIDLLLAGPNLIIRSGPAQLTVPLARQENLNSGSTARIDAEHAAATVEAFCRATGYYPTPPGAGR